MNKHKYNGLIILLLLLVLWGGTLNQYFLGEAYHYFDPANFNNGITANDTFAKIYFTFAPTILGPNIFLYQLFQLISFALLYLSIYFILFHITHNKFTSLMAAIICMSNFAGVFEMIAIGNYQRFIQRVPNLIPLFFSFYYLHSYAEKPERKLLYKSILLYSISFLVSHYSSFFLPLFIFTIIFSNLGRVGLRNKVVLFITYTVIALTFTSNDNLYPKTGIVDFLSNEKLVFEVLSQISSITFPPSITKSLSSALKVDFIELKLLIGAFALLIFIIVGKAVKHKRLYYTLIFSLLTVAILNLYAYGNSINVLREESYSRVYFPLSILFGLAVSLFFESQKKLFVLIFISLYFVYNFKLTSVEINKDMYKSTAMRRYVNYVFSYHQKHAELKYVVAPSSLAWPEYFFKHFLGENVNYFKLQDGWLESIPKETNFSQIRVVKYEYELANNGEYLPYGGKIIDETPLYFKKNE